MGVLQVLHVQWDMKSLAPGQPSVNCRLGEASKFMGQASRAQGYIPSPLCTEGKLRLREEEEYLAQGHRNPHTPPNLALLPGTLSPHPGVQCLIRPQAMSHPSVHLEPRRCRPGAPEHFGAFDFPVSSQTHQLASFTEGHFFALGAAMQMTNSETGPSGRPHGQAQGGEAPA